MEAISNNDGSLVYFEGGPVLFSKGINAPDPTPNIPSRDEESDSLPIAEWGENNDFPFQVRKAKESNPDLVSALDWKARALYAGGLDYVLRDRYSLEEIHHLPEHRKLVYELDAFRFRNRHYLAQASLDFYDLANVFPQIILTEDRSKIARIAAIPAHKCRYEKRLPNGDIKKVYLHPDWDDWTGSKDDPKLQKVALIDPLNADPDDIKAQRGETLKYIYPVSYPTGKNYYQHPFWWSIKVSKWLDFSNMIPTAKDAILKNMALIQYHIQMPDYWMPERYVKWGNMTDIEKKEATEKEFKIINDILHKPENQGKSVYTMFKTFIQTGKEYGGWKIEAVDSKMKDGALLADSSEATTKIFSATSIDPSLHGLIPGKGGSNRSGSDKREALNIYMSLIQPHEDCVLDPWNFTSWYNGWNSQDYEVIWFTKRPFLQTLNKVSPDQRETTIPKPDADQ